MHHLAFDLEIPFLCIYPTETSANLKNEAHTRLFIAAFLFLPHNVNVYFIV